MTDMVVHFITRHGPYQPGTAAAFDISTAAALVKAGVATVAPVVDPIVDQGEPAMKKLRRQTVDLTEKASC